MKGKSFIEKIDRLNELIVMFNASLSLQDGSKLALTEAQQEEIRSDLEAYKNLLLESDIKIG